MSAHGDGGTGMDGGAGVDGGEPLAYRLPGFYRPMVLGLLATFALVALGLLAGLLAGPAAGSAVIPRWFAAAWVAGAAWNAYVLPFRVAHALELDGGQLRWVAPLRSGAVPLAEVVRLRPSRFGSSVEVVERASGRPLLVWVRKGFEPFAAALAARRPGLPVRVGPLARLAERGPGRSHFHGGQRDAGRGGG